jgi:Chlorophyll A-B binding protein
MKGITSLVLIASWCAATTSAFSETNPPPSNPIIVGNGAQYMPGAVAPLGFWDPLAFSTNADANTLKRYREAELVHGRVAMLMVVGTFGGESLHEGPVISHLSQAPQPIWVALVFFVAWIELLRAQIGWVEPENVPADQPGLLRANYVPGNLGFDPLGLAPRDPLEFKVMQTKELQNGRLAMIAAIGFMAQEAVTQKGILENLLG